MALPTTTKALVLHRDTAEQQDEARLVERPIPSLKSGEVLVKIGAAGLNHRDVWIRKRLYPGVVVGNVLGSDGAGTIIASATENDPLLNKRVFLTPSRGWEKDPLAPESSFGIVGGGALPPIGTFSEYVVVERDEVIPTPDHLDDVQAAAWPMAAVTAWRATMVHAEIQPGQNVLITGVGGGVALVAMQLCIAKGASVYVTSGSEDKIKKAVELGAKGGANYKNADWPAELGALLRNNQTNPRLDAVIDSAGGDLMQKVVGILKPGGKVVVFGTTTGKPLTFTMLEILRNFKLIGTTMGSRKDLVDATEFLTQHRIVPHVLHVINGLGSAEEGFELMGRGDQFGKIVFKV